MSDTSLRRWAALHAASLPPGRRQTPPAVRENRDFDLAPAVLASCTQLNSWNLGSNTHALALAQDDGAVVMATGGDDGIVRIWEPTTGSLVRALTGHSDRIRSAKFGYGLDGQLLLATGSFDKTARIWNPETGAALNALSGHTAAVDGVTWGYHPDGQPLLTTVGQEGTGRIWDPIAGEVIHTLTGRGDMWWSAATGYRADRRSVLAIGQSGGKVGIWDPSAGQLEGSCSFTVDRYVVSSVGWGNRPGREPVLAAADYDKARIWADWGDASSDERPYIELAPGTGQMFALAWAPLDDGRTLLATTTSGALHLWDGVTGQCLYTGYYQFGDGFNHLDWVFAPGGELLLAAASTDGRAHLWDVRLEPQAEPSPASVPPSRERAAARGPRPVTILDPPEEVTPDFPDVEGLRTSIERVSNIERHGDHVLVAAVAAGGEIQIWDVGTGAFLRVITNPAHSQSVAVERSSGRAARLAAGSNDNAARIWDLDTGELLHTLTGHRGAVDSVAWGHRPDGRSLLATGGGDDIARIWDPGTGVLVRTLRGQPRVNSIAWGRLPDRRLRVATGDDAGSVRVWDPATGELLDTSPAIGGPSGRWRGDIDSTGSCCWPPAARTTPCGFGTLAPGGACAS
jgi:WD40 repeat protein